MITASWLNTENIMTGLHFESLGNVRAGTSYALLQVRVRVSGQMLLSSYELLYIVGKWDHQVLQEREPGQPVCLIKENAYKYQEV